MSKKPKTIDLNPDEYRVVKGSIRERIRAMPLSRRVVGGMLAFMLIAAGGVILALILGRGEYPLTWPGLAGINLVIVGVMWLASDVLNR